jgi:hypothetical protein
LPDRYAGGLVEIVGTIIIFWLIATFGLPYLVESFTETMGDNVPSPAATQ